MSEHTKIFGWTIKQGDYKPDHELDPAKKFHLKMKRIKEFIFLGTGIAFFSYALYYILSLLTK